jgi:hypothetical protein
MAVSGLAPAVSGGANITPPLGAATFAGLAPSLELGWAAAPALGATTVAGHIPDVSVGGGINVTPGTGAVSLAGAAPTVQAGWAETPAAGSVTAAGHAPVWSAGVDVTPSVGAVTASGLVPSVAYGWAEVPGAGAIAATGLAPSNGSGTSTAPPLGAVAVSGLAPVVEYGWTAAPATGAVTASGLTPTIEAGASALAGLGALSVAGDAPVVGAGVTVTPDAGATTISGSAPASGAGWTETPGAGVATVTGSAPSVGYGWTSFPGVGASTIAGSTPTVEEGTGLDVTPGAGAATFSGHVPYATNVEPWIANVATYVSNTGVTYQDFDVPEGCLPGDEIVALAVVDQRGSGGGMFWYLTDGTTPLTDIQGANDENPAYVVQTYRAGATPPTQVRLTNNGVEFPIPASVIILLVRGVDETKRAEVVGTEASGTSGMPDAGSLTTLTDDSLVLAFGALDDDLDEANVSGPSGYTLVAAKEGGVPLAGQTAMVAEKIVGTAGAEDPGAFGGTGSDNWWAIAVAFAPDEATASANPGLGTVAVAGLTPSEEVGSTMEPGAGAASIAGHVPEFDNVQSVNVEPGRPLITVAGHAPEFDSSATETPGAGAVTVAGHVPTFSNVQSQDAYPGVGAISFVGHAPRDNAPRIVSTATYATNTGVSYQDFDLPSGAQEGDELVVLSTIDYRAGGGQLTNTLPDGTSFDVLSDDNDENPAFSLSYYRIPSSVPTQFRVSNNGVNFPNPASVIALLIRGVDPTARAEDVSYPWSDVTGMPNSATLQVVTDESLAVVFGVLDDDLVEGSVTAPAGFELIAVKEAGSAGSGQTAMVAAAMRYAGFVDPDAFGGTGDDSWHAVSVAFAPVAGNDVYPALGALTASGHAPSVGFSETAVPDVGSLVAAGHAPTFGFGWSETPGLGAVAATGLAPIFSTTEGANPAEGVISVSGLAPDVSYGWAADTLVGAVTAAGHAPTFVSTPDTVTGMIHASAPKARVSAIGEVLIEGSIDASAALPTISATGQANHLIRGSVAVTAPAATASASGSATAPAVSGTISVTAPTPVARLSGPVENWYKEITAEGVVSEKGVFKLRLTVPNNLIQALKDDTPRNELTTGTKSIEVEGNVNEKGEFTLSAEVPPDFLSIEVADTPSTGVPINTELPRVSGTEEVGETLSVTTGSWSGYGITEFTYQWTRDGVDISGADLSTYVLVDADDGAAIRCVVTATNSAGSTSATSGSILTTQSPPEPGTPPAITGTAEVGQTLSCSQGSWLGGAPTSYAYQWFRGTALISGATSSTYTLVSADDGTSVTCRVQAINSGGSAYQTADSVTVTNPAPVAAGNLPDVSYVENTAPQTVATAGDFTGAGLSFSLQAAPTGTTIDPITGIVTHDPSATGLLNNASVVVRATNSGGVATTGYSISVTAVPNAGDATSYAAAIGVEPLLLTDLRNSAYKFNGLDVSTLEDVMVNTNVTTPEQMPTVIDVDGALKRRKHNMWPGNTYAPGTESISLRGGATYTVGFKGDGTLNIGSGGGTPVDRRNADRGALRAPQDRGGDHLSAARMAATGRSRRRELRADRGDEPQRIRDGIAEGRPDDLRCQRKHDMACDHVQRRRRHQHGRIDAGSEQGPHHRAGPDRAEPGLRLQLLGCRHHRLPEGVAVAHDLPEWRRRHRDGCLPHRQQRLHPDLELRDDVLERRDGADGGLEKQLRPGWRELLHVHLACG